MSNYASQCSFESYADSLEKDGLTLGAMIAKWHSRWQMRRALEAMTEERLDDIGLSREEAQREASKPFWKQ